MVKAPMSSHVKQIFVEVGTKLKKGEKIVSVFAMKMEVSILI